MKAGNTGHISNVLGTQLPTLGLKPPEEQLWPEQFLIAGVFLALSTHSCQLLPPPAVSGSPSPAKLGLHTLIPFLAISYLT